MVYKNVAFGYWQTRASVPLLPPRLMRDGRRVASLVAGAALMTGQLSVSLFLTYYLQTVLDWSALASGLGFLPISLVTTATATQVGTRLLPRLGPRVMMTAGLSISACGLLQLALLTPDSGYAANVLPALVTFSVGNGASFLAIMTGATADVPAQDAGIASASVNSARRWVVPSGPPSSTLSRRAPRPRFTAVRERPHSTASPLPSGTPWPLCCSPPS
ncbi:MFS transporter [Streptomyces sp. NBC_00053]|uniref:MFS transporter n=1 Tax=unclassified Streptomyces TaxID=2593676 RepID=UPI00225C1259|nr:MULTISPECIES: MFS transporter [unclassified Streptomyces]MCX4392021.1 MFS transporter [Streptomyces sp. NBC_01767]MCX5504927.1 MFS transporter [Streptomyces sp. NBC_00052]MCX5546536.1 MFS transporter [Streptomyces sp. NBC_00051]WSC32463.1 MFS transporter [Streptomyces sp. NBC_01768]WSP44952.1 MFS transporter [Streptomyces sp. NBC_01243]